MILFVSPWKQNEYFKTIWIKDQKTKQNKQQQQNQRGKQNKTKELLNLSEFTYSLFRRLVAAVGQKSGEAAGGVHSEPWNLQRRRCISRDIKRATLLASLKLKHQSNKQQDLRNINRQTDFCTSRSGKKKKKKPKTSL